MDVKGICQICGQPGRMHTCRMCGLLVCSKCIDPVSGLCKLCKPGARY